MAPALGAISHFDPDLKVQILGIPADKERELSVLPAVSGREILGAWLDDLHFGGVRIVLFKQNGRHFVETTHQEGSSMIEEYKAKPVGGGAIRYDSVEGSRSDDHLLVYEDGKLEHRDRDGLIGTARRIQEPSERPGIVR